MIRKGQIEDAPAIQNLICLYSEDGKMLFRSLEEIEHNIADFGCMKSWVRSLVFAI